MLVPSARTQVGDGTNVELQDCFNTWVCICDEAQVALEQQSSAEEQLKQFERHEATLETPARKTEVITEKTSSCPRAATQKVRLKNRIGMVF